MSKYSTGFTLVELLVVIAVLGSLAAMILINFGSQTDKAEDVERRSDIRQYQAALETYANRSNNLYPIQNAAVVSVSTICPSLGITACPQDPQVSSGNPDYRYRTDASGTKYVLWATLKVGSPTKVFVACSDGRVGTMDASAINITVAANCPLP